MPQPLVDNAMLQIKDQWFKAQYCSNLNGLNYGIAHFKFRFLCSEDD